MLHQRKSDMFMSYIFVYITIIVTTLSYAGDHGYQSKEQLFDICIPIELASTNIDKDSQIIVPVAHGRSVPISLDEKDFFTLESVRELIKQTKKKDDFFILASYRCNSSGQVSYLKHADAMQLIEWWRRTGKEYDPLSNLPIAKIDYHEFSYNKDMLCARYLGDMNILKQPNSVLDMVAYGALVDEQSDYAHMVLTKLHVNKKDVERARKYAQKISEDYFVDTVSGAVLYGNYLRALKIAAASLQQDNTEVAITMLNKITFLMPEAFFLLYTIHTQDEGNPIPCSMLADVLVGALDKKDPYAMVVLAEFYTGVAMQKEIATQQSCDFLLLSQCWYKKAADEYKKPCAMFYFFRTMTRLDDEACSSILNMTETTKADLVRYADHCMIAIEQQNDSIIELIRKDFPDLYKKTLAVIQKYATKVN